MTTHEQKKTYVPVMHQHNHGTCLEHALNTAETVCKQRQIRLTPARRRILELVCSSHKTISAYQLLDSYREQDPNAKPTTIYRALDFLIEAGLVHKVESMNAFFGCMQAESEHHSAILLCDQCQNVYEIDAEPIYQQMFSISQSKQFKPQRLLMELHGLCQSCDEETQLNQA